MWTNIISKCILFLVIIVYSILAAGLAVFYMTCTGFIYFQHHKIWLEELLLVITRLDCAILSFRWEGFLISFSSMEFRIIIVIGLAIRPVRLEAFFETILMYLFNHIFMKSPVLVISHHVSIIFIPSWYLALKFQAPWSVTANRLRVSVFTLSP